MNVFLKKHEIKKLNNNSKLKNHKLKLNKYIKGISSLLHTLNSSLFFHLLVHCGFHSVA